MIWPDAFPKPIDAIESTAVQVTGFDIDGVTGTEMYINKQKVALSPEIVGDMLPKTVTIPLAKDVLKQGRNTVTFVLRMLLGEPPVFPFLGSRSFYVSNLKGGK